MLAAACEQCGKTSRLGLHQKDGDRTNNSPKNLQTLCPSCHTSLHWAQGKKPWRRHPSSCIACGKPAKRLGLCGTHRSRLLRHGDPYRVKRQVNGSWLVVDERTGALVSGLEFRA
jgi:hypothetical protein